MLSGANARHQIGNSSIAASEESGVQLDMLSDSVPGIEYVNTSKHKLVSLRNLQLQQVCPGSGSSELSKFARVAAAPRRCGADESTTRQHKPWWNAVMHLQDVYTSGSGKIGLARRARINKSAIACDFSLARTTH